LPHHNVSSNQCGSYTHDTKYKYLPAGHKGGVRHYLDPQAPFDKADTLKRTEKQRDNQVRALVDNIVKRHRDN
jgi:hypothetical protein